MARGKKARKLVEATPPTLGQQRGDMMYQGRFDQDYGGFCPKNDDLCQMDTLIWQDTTTYLPSGKLCSAPMGPKRVVHWKNHVCWGWCSEPLLFLTCHGSAKKCENHIAFCKKKSQTPPPSFPLTSPSDKQRRSDKPNKTSSFGALGLWFVDAKWIQMVKTIGKWSNTE